MEEMSPSTRSHSQLTVRWQVPHWCCFMMKRLSNPNECRWGYNVHGFDLLVFFKEECVRVWNLVVSGWVRLDGGHRGGLQRSKEQSRLQGFLLFFCFVGVLFNCSGLTSSGDFVRKCLRKVWDQCDKQKRLLCCLLEHISKYNYLSFISSWSRFR